MATGISPDEAELLAIKALSYMADSEGTLDRFAAESGVSEGDIRQHIGERPFLIAVLDFLMANEALLVEFAEGQKIDPRLVGLAHHMLSR